MFERLPLYGYLLSFAGFIALGIGVSNHTPSTRAWGFGMIGAGLAVVGVQAILAREWRNGLAGRTYGGFGAIWRGAFSVACGAAAAYAAWWTLGQR